MPAPPGHAVYWLDWRRHHQAIARWYHYRIRLARDTEIFLAIKRMATVLLGSSDNVLPLTVSAPSYLCHVLEFQVNHRHRAQECALDRFHV